MHNKRSSSHAHQNPNPAGRGPFGGKPLAALGMLVLLASILLGQGNSDAAYRNASAQLNEGKYAEAITGFEAIVKAGQDRADAALYWIAYAQNRLGQRSEALATLGRLRGAYAQSRWLNDARALEIEIRQASGQTVAPDSQSNEELKLMAITGLMHSDPARAVPLLEKVLQGNNTAKVKEKAMFVLVQTGSPEAFRIVGAYARNSGSPDMQRRAIRYLGMMGGDKGMQELSALYTGSQSVETRREVLKAFMLGGQKARLLEAAKSESNAELRREAVKQLGLSGGAAEIAQLYRTETNQEAKEAMIKALFLAGDSARVEELARTESAPALRQAAIKHLGLMGAKDKLRAFYQNEKSPEVKEAILQAHFLAGDAEGLAAVAQSESDPELRLGAIKKIGLAAGKDAGKYVLPMYTNADPGTKRAIIQALFLASDDTSLIDLSRKETNPEIRNHIVRQLSLMGSKASTDLMEEILSRP